jgi:hypothetical protein
LPRFVWLGVALLTLGSVSVDLFSGHWTADIAASRFNGAVAVKAASLEFVVTSETVAITNRTIESANRDVAPGTTTLRTDSESHPHDELLPGLTVVARWRGRRLLDTVLTRRTGIVDHVTYEISDDGRTLTMKTAGPLEGLRSSAQLLVNTFATFGDRNDQRPRQASDE